MNRPDPPPAAPRPPAPLPEAGLRLERQLRDWIEAYARTGPNGPDGTPDDDRFDGLAREVFAYQMAHNRLYRQFAERRRAPADPRTWLDVPALPATALKEAAFATFDAGLAQAVFHTSGTTAGRPGSHYVRDPGLYEEALAAHFHHFVLPDLPPGARIVTLRLLPDLADSSLSHMLRTVADRFGEDGGVFIDAAWGLDTAAWIAALRRAEREGRPVLVMGAALGLLAACEALADASLRFRLPPGSRIMETGGFKGRRREISPAELHAMYHHTLGVDDAMVVNEYGMTELSSQFYDTALRAAVSGSGAGADDAGAGASAGTGEERRRLVPPPWMRARAVDPATLRPLPPGERGLLQVCDLANLHTVPFLLLEDVGRVDAEGRVTLEGRARGAEARGCSLTVEDLAAWRGRDAAGGMAGAPARPGAATGGSRS